MDKFEIRLWNGQYYAKVRMPDGTIQELKSNDDLTYSQWKTLIEKAWEESQKPPVPVECVCPNCKKPFVCPNNPNNTGIKI
jgi:hypothetical protein